MLVAAVSAQWTMNPWYNMQMDTAEVTAAKAQHYAAYITAAALNQVREALPSVYYNYQIPADTPEVAAAKAMFFQTYNAELARNAATSNQ